MSGQSQRVGLAGARPVLGEWVPRVTSLGYEAVCQPVCEPAVLAESVWLWIIVLRANDPPAAVRMWMKQLHGPKIVITPHVDAAALLVDWVPDVRVVVHPTRAIAALADMLVLMQSASTLLVLGPLTFETAPLPFAQGHSYVA